MERDEAEGITWRGVKTKGGGDGRKHEVSTCRKFRGNCRESK